MKWAAAALTALLAVGASSLPAGAQYVNPGGNEGGYNRWNDPRLRDQRRVYERAPGYGDNGYGYRNRGYDNRDYGRRGYDNRDDRRRGYGGAGYGRRQDPMAGMPLEDRKRAIRNERDAQKKIFKQQQLQRGLLGQ